MTLLTLDAVRDAAARIHGHVRRTPVLRTQVPTPEGERSVSLKLESLQVAGSFKPRGAVNSLLLSGAAQVVACSGGNHGLAVAWAAARLGRHATIVVPVSAATTKVEAMRRTGAEVILHGDVPAEAFAVAFQLVEERGWPMVHPYDQEPTIAGQGTLGLELLADAPEVTHWLTAVGGGGFAAGVALAFDGRSTLVAVEPEGCPSLFEALSAGHPVTTRAEGIARTSLGAPSLGDLAWGVLSTCVDTCSLVSDASISEAQRWLWSDLKLVAEPGGATALAALMSGAWSPPSGATVGVVICGGNADGLPE